MVSITNGFTFGTPTFYNRPAYPDERRWQVSDTVQWTHGNHNFKFGEDFIHTYDLSENLTSVFGSYSYSSVANYLTDYYDSQSASTAAKANHYTSYAQGFGPLGSQFTTSDYAVFAQDEWKVAPRLNLTLGLRYEFEQLPSPQLPNPAVPQTGVFPSNKDNIAPRVGFAFDAFGTGKTVLRGGFGIFNARLINSTIYNALAQTGTSSAQSVPSVTPTQAGAPAFPQLIETASAGPLPTVIYFDPNFKLPQVLEEDLNIEQNLGWNLANNVILEIHVDRITHDQQCPISGSDIDAKPMSLPVAQIVKATRFIFILDRSSINERSKLAITNDFWTRVFESQHPDCESHLLPRAG